MAESRDHATYYGTKDDILKRFSSVDADEGRRVYLQFNASRYPRFALLGNNPIPLFRENEENPGHFREYRQAELIAVGETCGLVAEEARIYSDAYASELEKYNTLKGRLMRALSDFAPESMRENHCVLYRDPGQPRTPSESKLHEGLMRRTGQSSPTEPGIPGGFAAANPPETRRDIALRQTAES